MLTRRETLAAVEPPRLGVELNAEVCRPHLADGSGFFE